jgi:hypothetical protein
MVVGIRSYNTIIRYRVNTSFGNLRKYYGDCHGSISLCGKGVKGEDKEKGLVVGVTYLLCCIQFKTKEHVAIWPSGLRRQNQDPWFIWSERARVRIPLLSYVIYLGFSFFVCKLAVTLPPIDLQRTS